MPNWIKTLKEKTLEWLIMIPLGALSYLGMKICDDLIALILPGIIDKIPAFLSLKLMLLSMLLNLALFLILYVKRNKKELPEPTIHYGIYFNWKFDPLCPSCKAPLQIESLPIHEIFNHKKPKLTCPNGHYNKVPTNDIGEEMHIASIRSSLIKDHFKIND